MKLINVIKESHSLRQIIIKASEQKKPKEAVWICYYWWLFGLIQIKCQRKRPNEQFREVHFLTALTIKSEQFLDAIIQRINWE